MTATQRRMESAWLTIPQAAEAAGVSTKTIRRWVAAGYLPAHRFGPRLVRVRTSDLEGAGRRIPTAGDAA